MSRTFLGEEPVSVSTMCQHRLLPKMEHAQTCPNKSPPDVVAVMTQFLMTQQLASPPDVYSIALMTKSSLGRFPTIKSITGRWLSYRKANSKRVRIYARQKFPGFDRGSGYSSIFLGRSLCLSRTFWGRSLCLCQHRLLPQNGTCPNMPNTRCRRRDDAIFDDATTSITTRCL